MYNRLKIAYCYLRRNALLECVQVSPRLIVDARCYAEYTL